MTLEGPMSLSARKQGPREAARRGRPHPGREHHPAHRSRTRRPCHMCVDICRHPSPPCTPEHVHARACARRPAQDSSRAQHPGESSVSLLPFSLEDIVLLLSKQTDSCLQLLQEPTGTHATWSSLRASVSSSAPGNASSQSWGWDGGPEGVPWPCSPFLAGKYTWPRCERPKDQAESRRSEWLPARNPHKNSVFRGSGSRISPQSQLRYKLGHWHNLGQIGSSQISQATLPGPNYLIFGQ